MSRGDRRLPPWLEFRAMATLDDVFARDIDTSSFAIYGGACTETDITEFEREIGFRLPEDFRAYSTSFLGGMYLEAREDLWPRPEAGDVGPFWSFRYAVKVFGLAADVPDWLDIRVQHAHLRAAGAADLVPFLAVEGDADGYCFDPTGRVVRWSPDDPAARQVVAGGFADVLLHEIGELEDRLQRKLARR